MAAIKALVLGDIAIDYYLQTETYPPEGRVAHASQSDLRLGGSGCLTALTLAGLGCPTALAGNLGSDMFAEFILQKLTAAKLDCSFVRKLPEQSSGFFLIATTSSGEHTTFGNRGANALPLPEAPILEHLKEFTHLHVSGYTLLDDEQFQVVKRILISTKEYGLTTSLDPGLCFSPAVQERVRGLLMHIDYFLPNLDELARLAGAGNLHDQMDAMLDFGCGAVVLKMGAQGSRYCDYDQTVQQKAPDISMEQIVNTTGAGDCFNGGFLAARLAGRSIQAALRVGNAAAGRILTSLHGMLDLISQEKN
jgi:sugar/nucleoside kinase (ribokinase family)